MKTIGLLGGMSGESSLEYYRLINEMTKELVGETHSCKSIMYTFDFDYIEKLQHSNDWETLTNEMVRQSKNLKNAGADFIVICTNTMHKMADAIEKDAGIKVLHICDATAKEVQRKGLKKVLLLGTNFTMMGSFYKDIFKEKYDIDIIIPNLKDRSIVHDVIYNELILGNFNSKSKLNYINIIEKMAKEGAEGVILGCTEIPLLIQNSDVSIEVFDTTKIHSKYAVEYANE